MNIYRYINEAKQPDNVKNKAREIIKAVNGDPGKHDLWQLSERDTHQLPVEFGILARGLEFLGKISTTIKRKHYRSGCELPHKRYG